MGLTRLAPARPAPTPRGQGVDGHKVGVELTVGVSEDSPQLWNQCRWTVLGTERSVDYGVPALESALESALETTIESSLESALENTVESTLESTHKKQP